MALQRAGLIDPEFRDRDRKDRKSKTVGDVTYDSPFAVYSKAVAEGSAKGVIRRYFRREKDSEYPVITGCNVAQGPGWRFANVQMGRDKYVPHELVQHVFSDAVCEAYVECAKSIAACFDADGEVIPEKAPAKAGPQAATGK
jgi:hypothetical protein